MYKDVKAEKSRPKNPWIVSVLTLNPMIWVRNPMKSAFLIVFKTAWKINEKESESTIENLHTHVSYTHWLKSTLVSHTYHLGLFKISLSCFSSFISPLPIFLLIRSQCLSLCLFANDIPSNSTSSSHWASMLFHLKKVFLFYFGATSFPLATIPHRRLPHYWLG